MNEKKEPAYSKGSILIVDDEPKALRVLSAILEGEGYSVQERLDCDSAIETLSRTGIDAVIADLRMPGKDGGELFNYVHLEYPHIPFIFLSAYGTVESAVRAVAGGAFYYFVKPPDFLRLKEVVGQAVEKRQRQMALGTELSGDRQEQGNRYRITGRSDVMLKVTEMIESLSDCDCSVLISGEAGTGKELAARAIHYGGQNKGQPFVDVNCSAMPGKLLESELFGCVSGARAGACQRRAGKLREAGCGTVFLDRISELELPLQAKLLRALQDGEVEKAGGDRKINAGFRLIASTSRDLNAEVRKGNFRDDLFYRINVVQIRMPSLKERMDDLPLLAMEFLGGFCRRENKQLFISDEALDIFQKYSWPGNVRQLRNVIERAVLLSRKESITAGELPAELLASAKKGHGVSGQLKTLKELELQAIRKALSKFDGNKSRAARELGISRKSFYKKLIGH